MLGKRKKCDLETGKTVLLNTQLAEVPEIALFDEPRKRISSECVKLSPLARLAFKEPLTPIIK
jgi:hypothetical protein